jgi:predicted acylesterase/phospholipase RssA
MTQPQDIQLAIQGGGAKISALLAAMEAVQELQGKELNVTRIAGTSAGSIVGCLFAAGVPLNTVKKLLSEGGIGAELVQLFPIPGFMTMAYQAYFGKPFWRTQKLEQRLESLFKEQNVHTLKDLREKNGIEVLVIAADLRDAQKVPIPETTNIVSAIMDSCGLPYCFRTWKAGKSSGPLIVDGGICENLPIDVLEENSEKYGPIAAISFAPVRRTAPTSVLSYSMALLDTAMNNSINRAKALLPADHVLPLESSMTTFEFSRALKEGLGDEYWRIKRQAKDFFVDFVKAQRRQLYHVAEDPWNDQNATLKRVMLNLGEMYEKQHAQSKFKYIKCDFVVQANCLLEEGELYHGNPDLLYYELTFQPASEPLYCVSIALTQTKNSKHLGKTSFQLLDAANNEIDLEYVPVCNPDNMQARELLIFFTPALPANSGPYRLRFRDQAIGLMIPLREKGEDELAFYPRRALGPVGRINLVLHIPERLKNSLQIKAPTKAPEGRRMTDPELSNYDKPNGFYTLGWTGENVTKQDPDSFKVDFKIL